MSDTLKSFRQWTKDNLIHVEWLGELTCRIDGKIFLVMVDRELLFDPNMQTEYQEEEFDAMSQCPEPVTHVAFEFGSKWYYDEMYNSEGVQKSISFNLLKYLGKADIELVSVPHLGIHGPFELCNGSRLYSDWCKKAKFLGVKALGICEQNTLAGALNFQNAAKKAGVDFIIGATVIAKQDLATVAIKLYVQNDIGWKNLLNIVNRTNVVNKGEFIELDFLSKRTEGLVVVLETAFPWQHESGKLILRTLSQTEELYYQIDPVEWVSQRREIDHLNALKTYLSNHRTEIRPILVCDSYYLDQSDSDVKNMLNKIGKLGDTPLSKDQYFKPFDTIFAQFEELFKPEDSRFEDLLGDSIYNLEEIVNGTNFEIVVGEARLPKYEMTVEEQAQYGTNEDMFFSLLEQGFDKKVLSKGLDEQAYIDRIDEEVSVIKEGGFIDYFLILADIVRFCEREEIMVGIGRGSAAGSLVSYCLGIVGLDPIKYNLLFSRFLNSGRIHKKLKEEFIVYQFDGTEAEMKGTFKLKVFRKGENKWIRATDLEIGDVLVKEGHTVDSLEKEIRERTIVGSLPDIDSDFPGNRRGDIKKYLEDKYGVDRVTSIGTYGTFKMKLAMKDACREFGVDPQTANYINTMIDAENGFEDLFKMAVVKPMLKHFIKHHPELVESTQLLMNQPKNASIHAAGVVIVPNEDAYGNKINIYDQMPVKLHNGLIVSEWEGPLIEQSGFLKCDILGTKQLEKLTEILKLIRQTKNIVVDLNDIDLDLPKAYEFFSNGWNEDVFQMGGAGLKGYCKKMKPENIEDCIATVALYRPGPMDIGAHEKYAAVKNGKEPGEADFGTEHIVEKTYFQIIYQEQVMQICVDLAGFTPNEADEVRKAMGKKIQELLDKYSTIFVAGAIKAGCPPEEAQKLWEKIEKFAGYAFNRSHAACYAMTAYQCQWLKATYPLEFWTIALGHAKDDEVPGRISELRKMGGIRLSGVDINNSREGFYSNVANDTIYWSLTTVKQVGDVAVAAIMKERGENGQYFSLEEFVTRIQSIKKSGVNKRHIANLILAGAFDEIENIIDPKHRLKLLKQFFSMNSVKPTEKDREEIQAFEKFNSTDWTLLQNKLSGYGFVEFEDIFNKCFNSQERKKMSPFIEETELLVVEPGQVRTVGGILVDVIERTTKKGPMAQLQIKANTETLWVTAWPEFYLENGEELRSNIGKIIFIDGLIKHDSFKEMNVLNVTDTTKINWM
jgi:DNA polymerase-3 subunit alpha